MNKTSDYLLTTGRILQHISESVRYLTAVYHYSPPTKLIVKGKIVTFMLHLTIFIKCPS